MKYGLLWCVIGLLISLMYELSNGKKVSFSQETFIVLGIGTALGPLPLVLLAVSGVLTTFVKFGFIKRPR